TVIQYTVRAAPELPCTLELRPLIAFRDYHSTAHENGALNPSLQIEPGLVTVAPYQGCPNLCLAHTAAYVWQEPAWYRNFEYTVEQERGLDYREDLFSPMVMTFDLRSNVRASLVASTEARTAEAADRYRFTEVARRNALTAAAPMEEPFVQMLARA